MGSFELAALAWALELSVALFAHTVSCSLELVALFAHQQSDSIDAHMRMAARERGEEGAGGC